MNAEETPAAKRARMEYEARIEHDLFMQLFDDEFHSPEAEAGNVEGSAMAFAAGLEAGTNAAMDGTAGNVEGSARAFAAGLGAGTTVAMDGTAGNVEGSARAFAAGPEAGTVGATPEVIDNDNINQRQWRMTKRRTILMMSRCSALRHMPL